MAAKQKTPNRLNLDEALAYLEKAGCPTSETTIRKYARIFEKTDGKSGLRVYRRGNLAKTGAFRFDPADLDKFAELFA